jgi:mannose-6-phosphate isomerase
VVARQIYVFAVAQSLGWTEPTDALIQHGLDFLHHRLQQADGTFASSVQTDGTVVNGQFDLYEQAFALFALAWAHRRSPSVKDLLPQQAAQTLGALNLAYRHPRRGYEESSPPSVPLKSNPHMHLFEATLAWEACAPDDQIATWQDLSDELAHLALERLIDSNSGALSEYFDHDWQRMPDASGDVVEPGHQFEWAWLLIRWGTVRQRPDAIAAAHRLVDLAERHGICPTRNVAINQINHAMAPVDGLAKLWPQTERIKAWCAMHSTAHTPQEAAHALAQATQSIQGLMLYLSHATPGLWQEVMLPDGSFTAEPCRASSLYHIVCAIETLHQVQADAPSLTH